MYLSAGRVILVGQMAQALGVSHTWLEGGPWYEVLSLPRFPALLAWAEGGETGGSWIYLEKEQYSLEKPERGA